MSLSYHTVWIKHGNYASKWLKSESEVCLHTWTTCTLLTGLWWSHHKYRIQAGTPAHTQNRKQDAIAGRHLPFQGQSFGIHLDSLPWCKLMLSCKGRTRHCLFTSSATASDIVTAVLCGLLKALMLLPIWWHLLLPKQSYDWAERE